MAVYNQVLTYTFRDTLASGNPQKIIYGAYFDGEFGAIHTASLDAVSLSLNNTIAGNNSFTGTNTFNGTSITTTFAGKIIVGAPTSGNTVMVNQFASTAGIFNTTSSGNTSTIVLDQNSVVQWTLNNKATTGVFSLASGGTDRITIGATGGTTITAPSSGTSLTINSAGGLGLIVNGGASAGGALRLVDGNAGNQAYEFGSGIVSAGVLSLYDRTNSAERLHITTTGAVTINAPSSGNGLNVSGVANTYAVQVSAPNTAGQSLGINFNAGTNSSDVSLRVQNAAGSANYFEVRGDGAVLAGFAGAGVTIANAGNVTIGAASSGVSLTVTDTAGAIQINSDHAAGHGIRFNDTNASPQSFDIGLGVGAGGATLVIYDRTNSIARLTLNAAGDFTIVPPSSGNAFTVTGVSGALAAAFNSGATTGSAFGVAISGGTNSSDYGLNVNNQANTQTFFRVRGDGVVLGNDGTNLLELGYKDTPQNIQTTYTLALSDRGKSIYTTAGAGTWTIPANASVAFPVGTTIVLINASASNQSLAITTDTLSWFQGGASSTGTRTIAQSSVVTLYKQTSTSWILTGNGIS